MGCQLKLYHFDVEIFYPFYNSSCHPVTDYLMSFQAVFLVRADMGGIEKAL